VRDGAATLAAQATKWDGLAHDAGKYLIKISTAKGGAAYTLEVKVR
jgi:hypothetical protein